MYCGHSAFFLCSTPPIQRREGQVGVVLIGWVQWIVQAMLIHGIERVVRAVLVDRVGGIARIVAVDGQARQVVEEAGAGIFVEPDNSQALAEAISAMASDHEGRRRMGISGREYIVSRLSREQTARTYISVLEKLEG